MFDVIIVGGGINGVGVLCDLARRGFKCFLAEKRDYSFGTSGASSGMIHGGPRYLLADADVTRLSCLDSGYIQKAIPNLLFRVPFLYPVYRSPSHSRWYDQILLEGADAFFDTYDEFVPLKNGKPHTRLSPSEVGKLEPHLNQNHLLGAITFDEWGIDVPRLCWLNVQDALEHGAIARNHSEVTKILYDEQKFKGVEVRDVFSGKTETIFGKILVNATGPWSPLFAKLFNSDIKLRGGKGIHLFFDRRLFNMAIATKAIDGREIFVMPYENTTMIGTTDDDYFGDLDHQRSTDDEIQYLLEGISQIYTDIKKAKVIYTTSGVRPTLYARGLSEDALSREHKFVDHGFQNGIEGILSILGGKLASYRIMAEELADLISKKLGQKPLSTTRSGNLPGGGTPLDAEGLAQNYSLDPVVCQRLIYRRGTEALKILKSIAENKNEASLACRCEPVTVAEMNFAVENEQVKTLTDLRLRTRMLSGPCQGTQCLHAALGACQKTGGMSAGELMQNYFDHFGVNRLMGMQAGQIKQEELLQAMMYCNDSMDM